MKIKRKEIWANRDKDEFERRKKGVLEMKKNLEICKKKIMLWRGNGINIDEVIARDHVEWWIINWIYRQGYSLKLRIINFNYL